MYVENSDPSISVVAPLICIQMNTTECLPNGLKKGNRTLYYQAPSPPHTQLFGKQVRGKGNFVLFSGSSQQWNRYSLCGHHN